MNNNNYPTEENSNINNDMTKYTIKSSFIDMSYSNYSFRKGINCGNLDLKQNELIYLVINKLDPSDKFKIELMMTPSVFYKNILEDKLKCLSNISYKECETLLNRISKFYKLLKDELDSKFGKAVDEPYSKVFEEIIINIAKCKAPVKDMFMVSTGMIQPHDFKLDCDCLNDTRNMFKNILENTADKSPLANNYKTPPSQNFISFTSEVKKCAILDYEKKFKNKNLNYNEKEINDLENKYKSEIEKYKVEINKLNQKNRLLTEELENLRKFQFKDEGIKINCNKERRLYDDLNRKFTKLKIEFNNCKSNLEEKDKKLIIVNEEKSSLQRELETEKSKLKSCLENPLIQNLKFKLNLCESEKQKLSLDIIKDKQRCTDDMDLLVSKHQKIIRELKQQQEKELIKQKENIKKCEDDKINLVKKYEEDKIKLIKDYDAKIQAIVKDTYDKQQKCFKEKEDLNIKIHMCEDDKTKIKNMCDEEKLKIKREFNDKIEVIRTECFNREKAIKEELEQCRREKKKCEKTVTEIRNSIADMRKKLLLECENKIADINRTYKIKEEKFNQRINELDYNVKICKEEKNELMQKYEKDKAEYEKYYKKKTEKIISDYQDQFKKCRDSLKAEKKLKEQCLEDLTNMKNLFSKEKIALITKYDNEIIEIKKNCAKNGINCKKEIEDLMEKIHQCSKEKANLIDKNNEEKKEIVSNFENKIKGIKADFKAKETKYIKEVEDLETKLKKCLAEKTAENKQCINDKFSIKNGYVGMINNLKLEIEALNDKQRKDLSEANLKVKICESEKTSLKTSIEDLKDNIRKCKSENEKCKIELASLRETSEKEKKELNKKLTYCEEEKALYTKKYQDEKSLTKKYLNEMSELKKDYEFKMEMINKKILIVEETAKRCNSDKSQLEVALQEKNLLVMMKDNKINSLTSEFKDKEDKYKMSIDNLEEKNQVLEEELKKCKNAQNKENDAKEDWALKFINLKKVYEIKLDNCKQKWNECTRQINQLDSEIANKLIIIKTKENKIEDLTNALKKALQEKAFCQENCKKEKDELILSNETCQVQKSKLEKKFIEINSLYEKCQTDLAKCSEESVIHKQSIDDWRKKHDQSLKKIIALERKVEEKRTLITSLKNQINSLKLEKSDCEAKYQKLYEISKLEILNLNKDNDLLKMQIMEKNKNYEACKLEIKKVRKDFKSQLFSKDKEIADLKLKLKQCEEGKEYYIKQFNQISQTLAICKGEVNQITLECKKNHEELLNQIEELKISLTNCKHENEIIENSKKEAIIKLEICEQKILEITKEKDEIIERLKREIAKLSARRLMSIKLPLMNNDEVNQLRNKLEECRKTNRNLTMQMIEKDAKSRNEMLDWERRLKKSEAENQKCKLESEKKIKDLNNEIFSVKKDYKNQINIIRGENEESKHKIEGLSKELKDCKESRDRCRKDLQELKKNIENNLKVKIQLLQKELETLKRNLSSCQNENIKLTEKYQTEINNIQQTYQDKIDKINKECSEKNKALVLEMNDLNKRHNVIIEEKTSQIAELREAKNNCDKTNEDFRNELRKVKELLSTAQNDLFICKNQLKDFIGKDRDSKIKIDNMTKEIIELTNRLKMMEDNLSTCKDKIKDMDANLKDTIQKLSELTLKYNTCMNNTVVRDLIICRNSLKVKDAEIEKLKKGSEITIEKCSKVINDNITNGSDCSRFDKIRKRFNEVCKSNLANPQSSSPLAPCPCLKTSQDRKPEQKKVQGTEQFISSMASAHRDNDLIDKTLMFKRLNRIFDRDM